VNDLRDFFLDDIIFVASGSDKVAQEDFHISDVGQRNSAKYCSHSLYI